MRHTLHTFNLHQPQADMPEANQHGQRRWVHQLLAQARTAIWPGILGLLVVLAMSLTFAQVVQDSVDQSALRHKAIAKQAMVVWRCNTLLNHDLSLSCHQQLKAAGGERMLPPQPLQASLD